MTLAEAGALCAGLVHQEHDGEKDLQGLYRLARWMVRFSPVVAVQPPDALFLDITGSERLFHGLDQLAKRVYESLTRLGFRFEMAMAETPGAAWAFTLQKKTIQQDSSAQGSMLDIGGSTFAFEKLPIAALRLAGDQILAFHNLGIETIGQLMALPRETLPARFGQSVLYRLDQALGHIPEPLVPVAHARPIVARIEFEGGIDSLADLWEAFKLLLEQITRELRHRNCGARQLVVDFLLPGEPPIVKTISLSRPTAHLPVLWNLLRCTTETVKCGNDGFSGLKLSVPLFDRLTTEQLHLLDQQAQAAAGEMDHLIARLKVRLGENTVLFPEPVESHLPEKAVCYEEVERSTLNQEKGERLISSDRSTVSISPLQRSTFAFAASDQSSTFLLPPPAVEKSTPKPRPLHLLPMPVEVQCASLTGDLDQRQPISFTHAGHVHQLTQCNGPERITGSWWEGRNKTRDYFDVEDRAGKRFWVFRVEETRKWYLHGVY